MHFLISKKDQQARIVTPYMRAPQEDIPYCISFFYHMSGIIILLYL